MVRGLCKGMIVLTALSMLLYDAFAAPLPPKKPKPDPKKLPGRVAPKPYQYVKTHDMNGDGVVNAKDRLIWINRQGGNVPAVLVSTENADLYEVMDYNNDGSVSKEELLAFYTVYDVNGNGVLEEAEIEAATD